MPFVPFSPGEQAVVAHKSIIELADELRKPVRLSAGQQQRLVGNIQLSMRNDASICSKLAREHYDQRLGARSIKAGVTSVEDAVLEAYLKVDGEIEEDGEDLKGFAIDLYDDEIICSPVNRT
jgi:hypothetical protein